MKKLTISQARDHVLESLFKITAIASALKTMGEADKPINEGSLSGFGIILSEIDASFEFVIEAMEEQIELECQRRDKPECSTPNPLPS